MPWSDLDALTPQALNSRSGLVFNVKDPEFGAVGDGTTDDAASIQSAINSAWTTGGGIVFLPAGIYNVDSGLSGRTGVSLIGTGSSTTISSGGTGFAVLLISDLVGFHASDFEIDGNQPASASDGINIDIGDTSTGTITTQGVTLERIRVVDADVFGIRIQPGTGAIVEDVTLRNVTITEGCSTTALGVLGRSVAGSDSTTRNVFVDNLSIISVNKEGVSINGWTSANAGNVVDSIFFNGMKLFEVNGFGWSPNEGCTNVYLDNFDIDSSGSANIQVEEVTNCAITNGAVRNGTVDGIRIVSTQATGGVATNVKIDNVEAFNNGGDGIDVGSISTQRPINVSITNCSVYSNTVEGINLRFADNISIIDNKCYDNGGAGGARSGILVPNSNSTVNRPIIKNNHCYGSGQDFGIRLGLGVVDGIVRDNICYDSNGTDMSIVGSIDAEGEEVQIRFGTIAAGTDDERPIFSARGPNGVVVNDCVLLNAATITADGTNFETFRLRDKGADGSESNLIMAFDTDTGGDNKTVTAFDTFSMVNDGGQTPNALHKVLTTGDTCSFVKAATAAGVGTDEMFVSLKYFTF